MRFLGIAIVVCGLLFTASACSKGSSTPTGQSIDHSLDAVVSLISTTDETAEPVDVSSIQLGTSETAEPIDINTLFAGKS